MEVYTQPLQYNQQHQNNQQPLQNAQDILTQNTQPLPPTPARYNQYPPQAVPSQFTPPQEQQMLFQEFQLVQANFNQRLQYYHQLEQDLIFREQQQQQQSQSFGLDPTYLQDQKHFEEMMQQALLYEQRRPREDGI
jgi:hypothetical protein